MAEGVLLIGANVDEVEDGLIIEGRGGDPLPGGGPIATKLDQRIAMSLAVAGLVSRDGVVIDDMEPVATSLPGLEDLFGSSEEHTSELLSLMRTSSSAFCLNTDTNSTDVSLNVYNRT